MTTPTELNSDMTSLYSVVPILIFPPLNVMILARSVIPTTEDWPHINMLRNRLLRMGVEPGSGTMTLLPQPQSETVCLVLLARIEGSVAMVDLEISGNTGRNSGRKGNSRFHWYNHCHHSWCDGPKSSYRDHSAQAGSNDSGYLSCRLVRTESDGPGVSGVIHNGE